MEEPALTGGNVPPPRGLTEVGDWLTYYSQCLHYELVMGQKFLSLLGQASLFSFTVSAAIFTLAERLRVGFPANLWVAVPSAVGLLMYAVIIDRYFMQIRGTGSIMIEIENTLNLDKLGLLHVLRERPYAFYRWKWTRALVDFYVAALLILPFAAVKLAS